MKSGAVSVDSVELTVSESEKDTAALVTKSGCDAPGPVEDTREQNKLQQQSIFQILCLASATVFGSLASVVFFLNLFFVTIGTNCVEGLVRENFTTFAAKSVKKAKNKINVIAFFRKLTFYRANFTYLQVNVTFLQYFKQLNIKNVKYE